MKLNILCQSPVSDGMSPAQAIRNTVQLARRADELGYHRFWFAEHHSDPALASAAPEVMIAHLAAQTQRIRLGSGGVLLPYYAPLKVAEQFRLLATLCPGRIDLGLGRSGGSEGHAPQALGMRPPSFDAVDELLGWLKGKGPYDDTVASPVTDEHPEPWVLGTSEASARYAGSRGLPYAFGGFLDPRGMMGALAAYHQSFQPGWRDTPYVNLAWYVQAADTQAEATALTRSSEHWFVETFLRGRTKPFPSAETTAAASYSPMEQMAIGMRRQFALVGTGEQVREGLKTMAEQLRVDEFTLVTIPFEHQARVRSYELIAEG